jgi:glycerol uptake facilitator-like aquaporin
MATAKAKNAKKSGAKNITRVKASEAKTVDTVEATKTTKVKTKSSKGAKKCKFFARKFDGSENILTIFKDTKILGAILGEVIGTGLISALAFTLGLANPLYWVFAYVGVTLAVFKLSGAHLNPAITAGMMASRRISAIRGVLYIIAQVIGAWAGFMIISGFHSAGVASGNIDATTAALPTLQGAADATAQTEGYSFFWAYTMIEFIGAIIISFFFARGLSYKKKPIVFATTVAFGVFLALSFAVLINQSFFYNAGNSFTLNPALSLMFGIFPGSAESFGALMSALMPMVVTYIVFPVLGGVLGFYLSDFASCLKGDKLAE